MESSAAAVSLNDIQPVLTAIQAQINVASMIGVLAGVVAITIGIVFMWWAVRKATAMIMGAFRKGRQ